MAKSDNPFDIPDQSLATTAPVEGSAAWMKQVALKHGDTSPQKLEKRREKLSVQAQLMEESLKNLQMQKKLFASRSKKAEAEALKALSVIKDQSSQAFTAASERVANIQIEMLNQEQNFTLMIQQSLTNCAMVEGLCLIVDSLTLREEVKSKSGKIGMQRYSNCLYAYDTGYFVEKTYRRTRKIFDLLLAQNPLLSGSVDGDNEDNDGTDDTLADDEDVVDAADRAKIKEDLTGGSDL